MSAGIARAAGRTGNAGPGAAGTQGADAGIRHQRARGAAAPGAGATGARATAGSRLGWALAGLAGLAGWMVLRSGELIPSLLPVCFLRETFGIRCATCGFTSALSSLARGDVAASFAAHPLAIPVALEIALAWLLWGLGSWFGRLRVRATWVARAAACTALAAAANWMLRLAAGG